MMLNGITIIWDHEVEAYMLDMQRIENRRQALQHAVSTRGGASEYDAVQIIAAAKKYEAYLNGNHVTLAPRRKAHRDKAKKRR